MNKGINKKEKRNMNNERYENITVIHIF